MQTHWIKCICNSRPFIGCRCRPLRFSHERGRSDQNIWVDCRDMSWCLNWTKSRSWPEQGEKARPTALPRWALPPPPPKPQALRKEDFAGVDTCESQQKYLEILHRYSDIISSSCFRSINCSLLLRGFPTLSSPVLLHYFKTDNLISMCFFFLVIQSEPGMHQ